MIVQQVLIAKWKFPKLIALFFLITKNKVWMEFQDGRFLSYF